MQRPLPALSAMRHSFKFWCLMAAVLFASTSTCAQMYPADPPETPLGDIARSMRKTPEAPAPKAVIDNDNFDKMMQEAESHHGPNSTMTFSFDADGKTFRVSPSPDVTCSLSFNAQATSLISDPYLSRELPADEVSKLLGPAEIQGSRLQVSVMNGTAWRVDEITVGVTILRRSATAASHYGTGKLIPASSETVETEQKAPDSTILYKMRAAAAPAAVTMFKTELTVPIAPEEDWHWAIVQAKGIPPRPAIADPTASAPQR